MLFRSACGTAAMAGLALAMTGYSMSATGASVGAAVRSAVGASLKMCIRDRAMDVMIRWFCILFGNQFTPDDVLDHYPVDRLMHDIALALMAVQTQTTEILDEFPTKAAKTEPPTATA